MSNPAVAEIKTKNGSLYVYSHWDGKGMVEIAKQAIKAAKPRWDDQSYGLRIIVDQITKKGRDRETGYGLSLSDDQGWSPDVIIDIERMTLSSGGLSVSFDSLFHIK